jgi:hypothetical protein
MTSSLPAQPLTGHALPARVARQARCADSGLDPGQWYPVSTEPAQARHEAAAAIAVCTSCPVPAQCLKLSLQHRDIGQHGAWGGPVATDRAHLHRQRPAGHRGRRRTAARSATVDASTNLRATRDEPAGRPGRRNPCPPLPAPIRRVGCIRNQS